MGCLSSRPAQSYKDSGRVRLPAASGAVNSSVTSVSEAEALGKPPNCDRSSFETPLSQASTQLQSTCGPASGISSAQTPKPANTNNWQRSAVDKGTQLLESLSAIDGTALEKVEAFTSLLVEESYVQFASVSVLAEDIEKFLVLTACGYGSEYLPKHCLMSVKESSWSVQRVVEEAAACFWSAACDSLTELPGDWKCLYKTDRLRSFLAVPIKVGTKLCGVLNVGLAVEVDEQKHWWGLQLRLIAAVLAHHFNDAHLCSKVTWLQKLHQQDTIQQLGLSSLQGLYSNFKSLRDLQFFMALTLPGRPCAILFSLTKGVRYQYDGSQDLENEGEVEECLEMQGFSTLETLLEKCLEQKQVMKVANCKRYLRLYKGSSDINLLYKIELQRPASVMVLPLIAPDDAKVGGVYVTSRTSTDFGMVRREVMDLVKLMVASLQQKLYSELNAKLVEVSQTCKFDTLENLDDSFSDSNSVILDSQKDLVLGTKPEKDMLISELQEQIRKQLAKVYKGQRDGSNTNLLDDLEIYDELGRGGYGTVYRASWRGQLAAVKIVCDRELEGGAINGALELALLTSISHPNIIQIHTYFADIPAYQLRFVTSSSTNQRQVVSKPGEQNCQVLVMDFCDMGSLADILATNVLRENPGKVNMPAVLHSLLEVASAMHYLHSIGIVHYDLKPENVLLKSSTIDSRGFTCKVADFGLSNIVSDNSYFCKHAEGTITHLAPEAMQSTGKLTKSVDVYAFGVMMWELYSGMRPYLGFRTIDVAVKVSKDGLRPEFPSSCPRGYKSLAQQCWQEDRRQRPSFAQICDRLQELLKDRDLVGRDSILTISSSTRLPMSDYFASSMARKSRPENCDFPLHIL